MISPETYGSLHSRTPSGLHHARPGRALPPRGPDRGRVFAGLTPRPRPRRRFSSGTVVERPASQHAPGFVREPASPPPSPPLVRRHRSPPLVRRHPSPPLVRLHPSPPPARHHHPALRPKPKHVPIVISPGIIASVLKGLPASPELQDFDPKTDQLAYSLREWQQQTQQRQQRSRVQPQPQPLLLPPPPPPQPQPQSQSQLEQPPLFQNPPPRSPLRPRHVPIVIPNFAHPYGPFPPTPSTSGGSTPRQSLSSTAPSDKTQPQPTEMPRAAVGTSRPSTAGSVASAASAQPNGLYSAPPGPQTSFHDDANSSTSSLSQSGGDDARAYTEPRPPRTNHAPPTAAAGHPAVPSFTDAHPPVPSSATDPQASNSATHVSNLMCTVHRCTGRAPRALVGATSTVLGDRLYVFGGKRLSRRRPQLTADLYELDLVRRHWTKLEARGQVPPPRYFHSVCALGDSKLICYGGMSPAPAPGGGAPQVQGEGQQQQQGASEPQATEVVVMSDIHVYDANARHWTHIPAGDNPQGRYAHCATVLPSSTVFASANAPLSAMHHNPSGPGGAPNQGRIGVALDGAGGAEMVVVGGQDSANHYIEQISVFNLRSLKWTSTMSLGRSCGAYRSVVAPLEGLAASQLGQGYNSTSSEARDGEKDGSGNATPASMLIYSNYNFLDLKLELHVRRPDGSLVEKPMTGDASPPGLRFPNGGVLAGHFVVSGTYLTSSRQEYALWALDLRALTWRRIDAGGGVFAQGSWNRGVLWPRRNAFVVLGHRRRPLVEDYNHRRLNFAHVCVVELEAFGLYDNPRRRAAASHVDSAYVSASAPALPPPLRPKTAAWTGAGRAHPRAAEELGARLLQGRELADMEILALGGERIPVNSHFLARRWGPYFVQLLREGASLPDAAAQPGSVSSDGASGATGGGADNSTLRAAAPAASVASRNSSITITPSINTVVTASSTAAASSTGASAPGASPTTGPHHARTGSTATSAPSAAPQPSFHPPTATAPPPPSRSRTLYLPHTAPTIHALLHFLHASALPPPAHPLCAPQVLCSLLQLARPYAVDGLLEATLERLHARLDGRSAAAVFNACAMAAGGGRGVGFDVLGGVKLGGVTGGMEGGSGEGRREERRGSGSGSESGLSSGTEGTSNDGSEAGEGEEEGEEEEVWGGERSCVVGLQKRGLRGLIEGRRMREGRAAGANGVA